MRRGREIAVGEMINKSLGIISIGRGYWLRVEAGRRRDYGVV